MRVLSNEYRSIVLLKTRTSSTKSRMYFTPNVLVVPFMRSSAFTPTPMRPQAVTGFSGLAGVWWLVLLIGRRTGFVPPLTTPFPVWG